ncbi:hypothetical protein HYW46_02320 [Candidatus Daviesbacteria bacterium]|nr:hypothetical protein [Candidatus Daviesbacteria bacterium]
MAEQGLSKEELSIILGKLDKVIGVQIDDISLEKLLAIIKRRQRWSLRDIFRGGNDERELDEAMPKMVELLCLMYFREGMSIGMGEVKPPAKLKFRSLTVNLIE